MAPVGVVRRGSSSKGKYEDSSGLSIDSTVLASVVNSVERTRKYVLFDD